MAQATAHERKPGVLCQRGKYVGKIRIGSDKRVPNQDNRWGKKTITGEKVLSIYFQVDVMRHC